MAKKEFEFKTRGSTWGKVSGRLIHYDPEDTRVLPENELDHVNDAHYETRPLKPKTTRKVNATSAAEELAEEEGLDLSVIDGTGVDGKVLKGDVQDALDE